MIKTLLYCTLTFCVSISIVVKFFCSNDINYYFRHYHNCDLNDERINEEPWKGTHSVFGLPVLCSSVVAQVIL